MPGPARSTAGEDFVRVAGRHPECRRAALVSSGSDRIAVQLELNVEMPLHIKAMGVSPSGVREVEPVTAILPPSYPWASPSFFLREDFPRDFPHLMPFSRMPKPCLVDGGQDEYFLQFGLAEYGVFNLVEQLAIWLRKAAVGNLLDPVQGWEPALRFGGNALMQVDAHLVRELVTRNGGWRVVAARYVRRGALDATLSDSVASWLSCEGDLKPLSPAKVNEVFSVRQTKPDTRVGNTVVVIIWPDKNPDGSPHVSSKYLPESMMTLAELEGRAKHVGCVRGLKTFMSNLERACRNGVLQDPIPIGIVLCARRPVHLVGTTSDVELLPYVVELRAETARASLLRSAAEEPVAPAIHHQPASRFLLRALSGSKKRVSLAFLGCGSVGSKLAMHAGRGGQAIVFVADHSYLRPHNLARHALTADCIFENKAAALARELGALGSQPIVFERDLVGALRDPEASRSAIPRSAGAVINSTASLLVREALIAAPAMRARAFEAALFGRGRGAFLLAEGEGRNPDHGDLVAELYATPDDEAMIDLLTREEGLTQVQVGQGCGSLTMIMDDARLSIMAAGLCQEINRALDGPLEHGSIAVGVMEENGSSTRWSRRPVPAFTRVEVANGAGWQLRLSSKVVRRIRGETAMSQGMETGGLMIGVASARLRTVTVVDVLEAPPDSRRTPTLFVLGKSGLQEAIVDRHERSGRTLFDVGTWHSHLRDTGPSALDHSTARALATERAPPSVLLIVTPNSFHAVMGSAA